MARGRFGPPVLRSKRQGKLANQILFSQSLPVYIVLGLLSNNIRTQLASNRCRLVDRPICTEANSYDINRRISKPFRHLTEAVGKASHDRALVYELNRRRELPKQYGKADTLMDVRSIARVRPNIL
jgi:hypothetical protein